MSKMIYEFNMKEGGAVVGDSAVQETVRNLFKTGIIPPALHEHTQYFNGVTHINVDCINLINWVRALVHLGRVPLSSVRILCEGVDCGLDRMGRLKIWPELMCVCDGVLDHLLRPSLEDNFYPIFKD